MRSMVMAMTVLALMALWCVGCDEQSEASNTVEAGERSAAKPSHSPAPSRTPTLVPLKTSLPKPRFKGTPYPLSVGNVPNLEDRSRWCFRHS